jgi:large subunit ribosomal protein L10
VALNLEGKKAVVSDVTALIANAQTMAVAEYRGVGVAALTTLRKSARDQGVQIRVLKNTLARLAIKGTSFESLSNDLTGPLLYSISEDAVAAAKVLNDFAKTNDKMVLKAGVYNGALLDQAGIKALASIPSREELLAKLAYVMKAPVSKMARALGAVAAQKAEAAEA